MEAPDRIGRASGAFIITIVVHCGLIYLLLTGIRESHLSGDIVDHPSELFFIDSASAPAIETDKVKARSSRTGAIESAIGRSSANAGTSVTTTPSRDAAITTPMGIDWNVAKDETVARVIRNRDIAKSQRSFTAADRRVSIPLPIAIARSDFPWDPLEGKRVGLTPQGLFYIKLSKKCMIVTVFLACAFGGDIKPVGDLFADIETKLDKARESDLP